MTVRYVTRAHAQKACRTVLGLSPSLARERLRSIQYLRCAIDRMPRAILRWLPDHCPIGVT